jgi:hypothetical protein
MATPTYRSINMTATLLGIDRRLCIVVLLLAFLVFRHVSFVTAIAAFDLLWSMAYSVTKHDVQLIAIVPKAAGVDTARLNTLDSLVGDGGVGFGWEQIRGTYIQFYRIEPAERTRVGFFSPANAVRTLLDAVIREELSVGPKKIFLQDCPAPSMADRKKQRK